MFYRRCFLFVWQGIFELWQQIATKFCMTI